MPRPWPVLLMVRSLDLGGSERQMAEVAKALDRSRFTPHVGCFHAEGMRGMELRQAGIPVVEFPVRSLRSPAVVSHARALGAYVRTHGIALVHPFDTPTVIFGVPAARMLRVPVVLASQRGARGRRTAGYRRALRVTDFLAHGIVVNCDFVRRELIGSYGVPKGRIHLCYNGVDLARFSPRDGARRAELAGARTVIGTVAALRPEKSIATLVQAFSRLWTPDSGLKLAIVGSGECRDSLVELARGLGVLDCCLFVPAEREVAEWYRSMDIFVLPSVSEAFSNALMEAMASGCCPVVSRVGGNPELVRDGRNGLLFPAGDVAALAGSLQNLLDNPERRSALSVRAREDIQGFSIGESAARMGDLYEELLEASSAGKPADRPVRTGS